MTIHERERPPTVAPAGQIGLRVAGTEYRGWKSASITAGIQAACGRFELDISDDKRTPIDPLPIQEEDECVVVIGSERVITGYVDTLSPSFDASSHGLRVVGRDKVGDLVDCSANPNLDKWEFKNTSVLQFCQKVARPFGITVKLQTGLTDGVRKKLSMDPGDTAFSAIERACRDAGFLPVSDGLGSLLLTRAGKERLSTSLVEGENMIAGGADYDAAGRFHNYVVLGQHRGSDDLNGAAASAVKGTAKDESVRRTTRTLIIRPESGVTEELAKKRAEWEATTRKARSNPVYAVVQGWTQDGKLWPRNVLVPVRSPRLKVNGDMLIAEATFSLSPKDGTQTRLSLVPPDAFLPEPTIPASSDGRWKEIIHGV